MAKEKFMLLPGFTYHHPDGAKLRRYLPQDGVKHEVEAFGKDGAGSVAQSPWIEVDPKDIEGQEHKFQTAAEAAAAKTKKKAAAPGPENKELPPPANKEMPPAASGSAKTAKPDK